MLVLALAAVASVAPRACAEADAARADSVATAPDSTRAQAPASAGAARARPAERRVAPGEKPRPWHATPFAIMARSALVPGWGQAANHRWIKAGLVAGAEGYAGARFVKAWSDVRSADQRVAHALRLGDAAGAAAAQAESDRAFVRRANAGWLLGIAAALSMMDAYVDAHFIQFDADFGPDPELPDGAVGVAALSGRPLAARAYLQFDLP